MREGIAHANRTMFVNLMGTEWLPIVSDAHKRLRADPPARVADIGCGAGWSSISIARAYPKVRVDGFDLDEDSIAEAKANAEAEGLTDRVTFQVRDAADPELGQIRPGDRHRAHTRHEPTCGGPTGDALYGRQRRSGARGRRAGREESRPRATRRNG